MVGTHSSDPCALAPLRCRIHSSAKSFSNLVQRFSLVLFDGLEVARCESRYLLELIGQVLNTAITHLVCDLTQRHLIIDKKFFHALDFLKNQVLLDLSLIHISEPTRL